MLIAIIKNALITVGDYRELFPNTSFAPSGPDSEFMDANGCLPVSVWKSHDRATQKLVPVAPYVEDGQVFTVAVHDKTAEEIAAEKAEKLASLQADIVRQTQDRLDAFAQTRGYDGILSACTYATSTVDKFRNEGTYCVEARDATWRKLYEVLAEVEAGTRPAPNSYTDIEPELPPLTWPK